MGRMKEMSGFNDFLEEQLQDPKIKAEYDALEAEFTEIKTKIRDKETSAVIQKEPQNN